MAFVVLAMLGIAGTALASEVVDLRVGSHPDFTRVVFELDTPAGYRIERSSSGDGGPKLIISIEATSIPRKVQSNKSLVGLVKITPRGDRSIAQIELKKEGLNLKEMILANPPRIVLDVLTPATAQPAKREAKTKQVAKAQPPEPTQPQAAKPSTSSAEQSTKAKNKAKNKTQASTEAPKKGPTQTESRPAAKSTDSAKGKPADSVKPLQKAPSATTTASEVAGASPSRPGAESSPRSPAAAPGSAEPSEGGIPTMGMEPPTPSGDRMADTPPGLDRGAPAASRKPNEATERKLAARPPIPSKPQKAKMAEQSSGGYGMIGIGLALIGVIAVVGAVVMRRRGAARDRPQDEAAGAPESGLGAAPDDNPFSGLASRDSSQPVLSASPAAAGGPDDGGIEIGAVELGGLEIEPNGVDTNAELKQDEPVDSPALRETSMQLDGGETMVTGIGDSPVMQAAPVATELGGSEEITKMMLEFERRVASLETRLDEVVDARERLERQVAAQTEELRVQRAAIARTQRAVRNLSRPEEEGPTEPALRDPQ